MSSENVIVNIHDCWDRINEYLRCKLCHKNLEENEVLCTFTECSDLFCKKCIARKRLSACPVCKQGSLDSDHISKSYFANLFKMKCNVRVGTEDLLKNPRGKTFCLLQDLKLSEKDSHSVKSVKPVLQASIFDKLHKSLPDNNDKNTSGVYVAQETNEINASTRKNLNKNCLQNKSSKPLSTLTRQESEKFLPTSRTNLPESIKSKKSLKSVSNVDTGKTITVTKSMFHDENEVTIKQECEDIMESGIERTESKTSVQPNLRPTRKRRNTSSIGNDNQTPKRNSTTICTNKTETPIVRRRGSTLAKEQNETPMKSRTGSRTCISEQHEVLAQPKTPKPSIKCVTTPQSVPHKQKRNIKGETELITACRLGDTGAVTELINSGADVNAQDNAKWTPLHEAANHGFLQIVEKLLDAGAFINVPGLESDTPLHDAVKNNRIQVVKLLIQRGADMALRNSWGLIPSDVAETEEMKAVLKEMSGLKPTVVSEVIPTVLPPAVYQKSVVLLGTSLSRDEQKLLKNLVKVHKWRLAYQYSAEVTHIVAGMQDEQCIPSLPVLCGILQGKWIVNSKWIEKCEHNKEEALSNPKPYEVQGTSHFAYSHAAEQGRINAIAKRPGLFYGCHFFVRPIIGNYRVGTLQMTKQDLADLIRCGEGSLLSREPDPETIPRQQSTVPYHAKQNSSLAVCSHYILYQRGKGEPQLKYKMPHIKTLPLNWLLDSAEAFQLTEVSQYV